MDGHIANTLYIKGGKNDINDFAANNKDIEELGLLKASLGVEELIPDIKSYIIWKYPIWDYCVDKKTKITTARIQFDTFFHCPVDYILDISNYYPEIYFTILSRSGMSSECLYKTFNSGEQVETDMSFLQNSISSLRGMIF